MANNFHKKINNLIPLHKLLGMLLGMVIGVEIIVITYNHLSGFYVLDSFTHFIIRLLRGTSLGMLAGFIIAIPDLLIINLLNRTHPWSSKVYSRIAIQFMLTISIAAVVSTLITILADSLSAYAEDINVVLIYNALIYAVVNIIMMVVLEAWLFFTEGSLARSKAEALERELSQIRFEMLKSQINPHFMFNSLNVLSGLIEKDVHKAQQFIDEFALIYRYVLETIEKPVVSLGDELGFVRSYIFLQQIRYGDSLNFSVNLPSGLLKLLLPPLSMQMVLENAIKHNIVNTAQPLIIEVFYSVNRVIVRNNLQPKISSNASTGLGQINLVKRYASIGEAVPVFIVEARHYTVKLPLINKDSNEGSDN